jgi:hypothetical protein
MEKQVPPLRYRSGRDDKFASKSEGVLRPGFVCGGETTDLPSVDAEKVSTIRDKNVRVIESASPWVLPEDAGYRREPARPANRRPGDFEALFDARTVFYDCFRLTATQVMLIAPPLNRFAGVLDSLSITSLPTEGPCRYQAEQKFATGFAGRQTHTMCRVVVDVPESDISLSVQCRAGSTVLQIKPDSCTAFRGRRVLLTLSRNNDLRWICDWMRFHRDLHHADAVLLYDNGSTTYTAASLLEAMKRVSGFKAIAVVEWPYKYGPQGIGRGTWDSAFCQDGALEDARWRFLADAYAVLSCDIDELVLSDAGSVFDRAAGAAEGHVKFSGRWVNAQALNGSKNADQTTPRHRDSTLQLLPQSRWQTFRRKDVNLCPAKWAVVPNRCPQAAQWSVHEIVGMRALQLKPGDMSYRHFRQIGTNWKNNRASHDLSGQMHQEDARLREAFARVRWDE